MANDVSSLPQDLINDWIGKIQVELGVMMSNQWLLEVQNDRLQRKILQDAQSIEHQREQIDKLLVEINDLRAQLGARAKKVPH